MGKYLSFLASNLDPHIIIFFVKWNNNKLKSSQKHWIQRISQLNCIISDHNTSLITCLHSVLSYRSSSILCTSISLVFTSSERTLAVTCLLTRRFPLGMGWRPSASLRRSSPPSPPTRTSRWTYSTPVFVAAKTRKQWVFSHFCSSFLQITRLKIDRNPFAKGFRDSGRNRYNMNTVFLSCSYSLCQTEFTENILKYSQLQQLILVKNIQIPICDGLTTCPSCTPPLALR